MRPLSKYIESQSLKLIILWKRVALHFPMVRIWIVSYMHLCCMQTLLGSNHSPQFLTVMSHAFVYTPHTEAVTVEADGPAQVYISQ